MRHFGRALVPTMFDFGTQGQRPSHPALLDWLAVEFMREGWSLKKLHRLLVTSATYRMDSTPDPAALAADSENKFLWRMAPRRLEAEAVRDSTLYVCGRLDPSGDGPELDHLQGLASRRRSLSSRAWSSTSRPTSASSARVSARCSSSDISASRSRFRR